MSCVVVLKWDLKSLLTELFLSKKMNLPYPLILLFIFLWQCMLVFTAQILSMLIHCVSVVKRVTWLVSWQFWQWLKNNGVQCCCEPPCKCEALTILSTIKILLMACMSKTILTLFFFFCHLKISVLYMTVMIYKSCIVLEGSHLSGLAP